MAPDTGFRGGSRPGGAKLFPRGQMPPTSRAYAKNFMQRSLTNQTLPKDFNYRKDDAIERRKKESKLGKAVTGDNMCRDVRP